MLSNLIFARRFDYRNESKWCSRREFDNSVNHVAKLHCNWLLTIIAWPGRGIFPEKLGGRLRPLPKALALYIQPRENVPHFLLIQAPDRIWRGRQRSNCAVINPTSADCSNKQLTQEGNFENLLKLTELLENQIFNYWCKLLVKLVNLNAI